ncbi:hypothetical protein Ciccas_004469 [Cichlidogyrus casuarinus]|uniref:Calponin-homology (CH) domain-containing protein n=1 Tax=Cichlidogyrus casuarinus TaxID=1844966 RepID=A0ABD2QBE6_9PLAT
MNRVFGKFCDPPLFRPDAQFKSSDLVLLKFSKDFLAQAMDLHKRLFNLGAKLLVSQSPLDELSFTISDITSDLRDGIRLIKLAEVLLNGRRTPDDILGQNSYRSSSTQRLSPTIQPGSLLQFARYPAISILQKIFNCDLAIRAFCSFYSPCDNFQSITAFNGKAIEGESIVCGHRELTLSLLWAVMLRFRVSSLFEMSVLEAELLRLGDVSLPNKCDTSKSLLTWARAVCSKNNRGLSVQESENMDSRVFCAILNYYLPTLLPWRLVLHPVEDSRIDAWIANKNLRLFNRKLNAFGDVPTFSLPTHSNKLSSQVVLSLLAFLAARLLGHEHRLVKATRDHAARLIQSHWHNFLLRRHDSHPPPVYQQDDKANRAAQTIQLFWRRRRMIRAAIVIQTTWRKYRTRNLPLTNISHDSLEKLTPSPPIFCET